MFGTSHIPANSINCWILLTVRNSEELQNADMVETYKQLIQDTLHYLWRITRNEASIRSIEQTLQAILNELQNVCYRYATIRACLL